MAKFLVEIRDEWAASAKCFNPLLKNAIQLPSDAELINATELIDTIKYMCDDGTEEEQRWGEWFKRVIQAQINREKARRLKGEDNGIHET